MSTNQDVVIKESLVVNIYKKYHEFINFMRTIPVDQNNMLAQEAFKMIDIGVICFEKVINHCPLIQPPAPVNDEVAVPPSEVVTETEVQAVSQ